MIERQYIFRRKLQVLALILGALAALICFLHKLNKLDAHVDSIHPDLDFIVQEILQEMKDREKEAGRELRGDFYRDNGELYICGERCYEQPTQESEQSGIKHD